VSVTLISWSPTNAAVIGRLKLLRSAAARGIVRVMSAAAMVMPASALTARR
jgi:hypothetical protein